MTDLATLIASLRAGTVTPADQPAAADALEPAPLTVADALAVPEVRALVEAAKAYAFENVWYDEENSIAMNAWRSARSKLAAALRGIGGAE